LERVGEPGRRAVREEEEGGGGRAGREGRRWRRENLLRKDR